MCDSDKVFSRLRKIAEQSAKRNEESDEISERLGELFS